MLNENENCKNPKNFPKAKRILTVVRSSVEGTTNMAYDQG